MISLTLLQQEVRSEYVRHFLTGEMVLGRDHEAQLSKTLLPRITASDAHKLTERYRSSCDLVVKTVSHKEYAPPQSTPPQTMLPHVSAACNEPLCPAPLAVLMAFLAEFSAMPLSVAMLKRLAKHLINLAARVHVACRD